MCTVGGTEVYAWEFELAEDNDQDGYSTGLIKFRTETIGTVESRLDYVYDPLGRLAEVWQAGEPSTMIEKYTYRWNGARETDGERAYSYDADDRLVGIDDGGTVDFTYNAAGFLTARDDAAGTTTYDYSLSGRLHEVVLPDATRIEYVHDPLGRRVAKKKDGAIKEKYLWGNDIQLLAVYAYDEVTGTFPLRDRYLYAGGRLPAAMERDGKRYYLCFDQAGSLRLVVDGTGSQVKRINYDSFGQIITDTATGFELPFGFAGGYHDRETGLVRFGFRDYDPDTGRWTAKDPVGFAGKNLDLYAYVQNNPVGYTDPWELRSLRHVTSETDFFYDVGADEFFYRLEYTLQRTVHDTMYSLRHGPAWHRDRNMYNQEVTWEECRDSGWILQSDSMNMYHRFGEGNGSNVKYLSPDGHSEQVFTPIYDDDGKMVGGNPVTSPENSGTYNYSAPTSLGGKTWHLFPDDVLPYWIWGNSPDDQTPFWDRLFGAPKPKKKDK